MEGNNRLVSFRIDHYRLYQTGGLLMTSIYNVPRLFTHYTGTE